MTKLEVFDPPMCCSTGICGEHTDSTLVVFASDLEWLKVQGVQVVRRGLAFEPSEFLRNEIVRDIIQDEGNISLPVLLVNGRLVSKASYPSREQLAQMCGVEFNEDDAPPIEREENCCCGVDCDCRSPLTEKEFKDNSLNRCNCMNAAAEDNCICTMSSEEPKKIKNSPIEIIFAILILVLLAIMAVKMLF